MCLLGNPPVGELNDYATTPLKVFKWNDELTLYCEMDFEKQTRKRKFQENSIINIQHGIFKFQVKKRERKVFGENAKPKTAMK